MEVWLPIVLVPMAFSKELREPGFNAAAPVVEHNLFGFTVVKAFFHPGRQLRPALHPS